MLKETEVVPSGANDTKFLENTMVVELGYKSLDYLVNASTLKKGIFGVLQNRRNISSGTVRSIKVNLEQGINFDSQLVINKIGNDYFIIDGNHRYEAMCKFLAAHPTESVRVKLAIYDNLDPDEEKEVYTRWNKGRKQSTNDVVKQYEQDIELFKHLSPMVDVYGTNGNISFFKAVGAYIAAQDATFTGGYIGSAFDFVDLAQKLKKSDGDVINAFLKDYVAAFGSPAKNSWYKTTPYTAMFKIWYDNRKTMLPLNLQVQFASLATSAPARYWHGHGGASACTAARREYLNLLNGNRRKNLFVDGDANKP